MKCAIRALLQTFISWSFIESIRHSPAAAPAASGECLCALAFHVVDPIVETGAYFKLAVDNADQLIIFGARLSFSAFFVHFCSFLLFFCFVTIFMFQLKPLTTGSEATSRNLPWSSVRWRSEATSGIYRGAATPFAENKSDHSGRNVPPFFIALFQSQCTALLPSIHIQKLRK